MPDPGCARECFVEGRCRKRGDECVASSEADCRASADCIDGARCDLDETERRCVDSRSEEDSDWLAAGIVLSSIGPSLMVVGVVPTVIGFQKDIDAAAGVGIGCLITGGSLLVVGLVSFSVVATSEPKHDDASPTVGAPASEEEVSLHLSPTGASLVVSFF